MAASSDLMAVETLDVHDRESEGRSLRQASWTVECGTWEDSSASALSLLPPCVLAFLWKLADVLTQTRFYSPYLVDNRWHRSNSSDLGQRCNKDFPAHSDAAVAAENG